MGVKGRLTRKYSLKLMKFFWDPTKRLVKTLVALACVSAVGAIPVFAQVYTLGNLVASGAAISIGDKSFSGFSWTAKGADASELNSQASALSVSASIANGIYYLDFSGSLAVNNLAGGSSLSGELVLGYTVTASSGSIAMIDQNYTPTALPVAGNQIVIAETVANVLNVVVANSTLTLNPQDLSDPNPEAGDNLNINPPQQQLSVIKDIVITAAPGQLVGLSDVEQSFHQVPEPGTMLLGSLGGGLLLFLRSRRKVASH